MMFYESRFSMRKKTIKKNLNQMSLWHLKSWQTLPFKNTKNWEISKEIKIDRKGSSWTPEPSKRLAPSERTRGETSEALQRCMGGRPFRTTKSGTASYWKSFTERYKPATQQKQKEIELYIFWLSECLPQLPASHSATNHRTASSSTDSSGIWRIQGPICINLKLLRWTWPLLQGLLLPMLGPQVNSRRNGPR